MQVIERKRECKQRDKALLKSLFRCRDSSLSGFRRALRVIGAKAKDCNKQRRKERILFSTSSSSSSSASSLSSAVVSDVEMGGTGLSHAMKR